MDQELSDELTNSYDAYRNTADNRGQAIKLEFRFANGDVEQFEYSYLTRTSINSSAGKIVIRFMNEIVTIEGHNLTRLKDDLRHNKVDWIQEADSEFENTNSESILIKKITIEESKP